jgi:membrane protein DedA with SNARE-associated domain
MEMILHWVSQYGYAGIFVLLTLGIVALSVPDETLLAFSGFMVYSGRLDPLPTFCAALLGSLCGISLSYGLGRSFGFYLVRRYGRAVRLTPELLERVNRWFDRLGKWSLTFGYYFPGIRHLTAYVAGTARLRFSHFALYAYSGALVWVTTYLALGYFLGRRWETVSRALEKHLTAVSVALLVLAALLVPAYLIARRRKRAA